MKNPISKIDAEQMAEKFYDFHDKIWEIVKELIKIQNEGDSHSQISLNHYCVARHDKNIIVANYYTNREGYSKDIQFPLSYLYDDSWQEKYKNKLIEEKQRIAQSLKQQTKERDLKEIKRLKELYPEEFFL